MSSPSISDHPCGYLEKETRDITDPHIESDLIRMGVGEGKVVDREYGDPVSPCGEIQPEVEGEIS